MPTDNQPQAKQPAAKPSLAERIGTNDEQPQPAAAGNVEADKKPTDTPVEGQGGTAEGEVQKNAEGGEGEAPKTLEQLQAELAEERTKREKAEADKKKALKEWNAQNMRLKTKGDEGAIDSKVAKEILGNQADVDPNDQFGTLGTTIQQQKDMLEAMDPDAMHYVQAAFDHMATLTPDEVDAIADDLKLQPAHLRPILIMKRGQALVDPADLAVMREFKQTGNPVAFAKAQAAKNTTLAAENEALKTRLAEFEAEGNMTVSGRAPLRTVAKEAQQNAAASESNVPLGLQIRKRKLAITSRR